MKKARRRQLLTSIDSTAPLGRITPGPSFCSIYRFSYFCHFFVHVRMKLACSLAPKANCSLWRRLHRRKANCALCRYSRMACTMLDHCPNARAVANCANRMAQRRSTRSRCLFCVSAASLANATCISFSRFSKTQARRVILQNTSL